MLLLLLRGKVFLQSIAAMKTSTIAASNIIILCRMYIANIEKQLIFGRNHIKQLYWHLDHFQVH
jgi:hypothetical protein